MAQQIGALVSVEITHHEHLSSVGAPALISARPVFAIFIGAKERSCVVCIVDAPSTAEGISSGHPTEQIVFMVLVKITYKYRLAGSGTPVLGCGRIVETVKINDTKFI